MRDDATAGGPHARMFDAIVVGAGPAGEVCAGRLAARGLRTALVERELVGGECSYWACMPSKALLRPGELVEEARRVGGVDGATLAPIAVLRRRDEVVHDLRDESHLPWVEDHGIALVRGRARLDGERRVRVRDAAGGEVVLTARRAVVLATGSEPILPPVPGLAAARPWTNRELTTARRVPSRMVMLGGGVVGVEMAQAWARLGARVTVLEAGARLIGSEEPVASELVADGLRAAGVDVRVGVRAAAVRRDGVAGATAVELEDGAELVAEVLAVGTGRRPRRAGLGLETVGLDPGRPIEVDGRLRVGGRDWLYAIGDVAGRAQLTHAGKLQARLAARAIAGEADAAVRDDGPPPRVIFTTPQVAAVGFTLAAARAADIAAEAVDGRIDAVAGASFHGRGAEARVRFVVDHARRVLVGATFVGPGVSELVHAATIAIVGAVPVDRLVHAAPPFPTLAEAWLPLADWADA